MTGKVVAVIWSHGGGDLKSGGKGRQSGSVG